MNKKLFYQQADLLISILPYIAKDNDFALHGGTAINFFVLDMPRISIDIDLTYLRIRPYKETLEQISLKLKEMAIQISKTLPLVQPEEKMEQQGNFIEKLFVRRKGAIVKIEPNRVIRGHLFPLEEKDLCKRAEDIFEKFVTVKTLSFAELYGAKICAALDRQHPRDIFDIRELLRNEGITEKVRKAFLGHLISHKRPISEILAPNLKDMRPEFERAFVGMPLAEVKYQELQNTRKALFEWINKEISDNEREFLISFKEGIPKWELLGIEKAKDMPAVKWKLANLAAMDKAKHQEAIDKLKRVLGL